MGAIDGEADGPGVGEVAMYVGDDVGALEGDAVGGYVGIETSDVGVNVGRLVGRLVGLIVGFGVGLARKCVPVNAYVGVRCYSGFGTRRGCRTKCGPGVEGCGYDGWTCCGSYRRDCRGQKCWKSIFGTQRCPHQDQLWKLM